MSSFTGKKRSFLGTLQESTQKNKKESHFLNLFKSICKKYANDGKDRILLFFIKDLDKLKDDHLKLLHKIFAKDRIFHLSTYSEIKKFCKEEEIQVDIDCEFKNVLLGNRHSPVVEGIIIEITWKEKKKIKRDESIYH